MCQDSVKSSGIRYLSGITFVAGFVIGVVGILTIFSKYTTSSGGDTVDRTILLI